MLCVHRYHLNVITLACLLSAAKLGRRSRKMREMIRSIEDTQTEQALHGLLSLSTESNMEHSLPALSPSLMASDHLLRHGHSVAGMVPSSVISFLPISSQLSSTSLSDSASDSSMAALSLLLRQRSVGHLIGQPMVAEDTHLGAVYRSPSSGADNCAFEACTSRDGSAVLDVKQPLMLNVDRFLSPEHSSHSPHSPSICVTNPCPFSSLCTAGSSLSTVHTSSRLLHCGTLSHHGRATFVHPSQCQSSPMFEEGKNQAPVSTLIKNELGRTVDDPSILIGQPEHPGMAQSDIKGYLLPLSHRHGYVPTVEQHDTLDLRKKSDDDCVRSPLKKRPYIPTSVSDPSRQLLQAGDSSLRMLSEASKHCRMVSCHHEHRDTSHVSCVYAHDICPGAGYSGHYNLMREHLKDTLSSATVFHTSDCNRPGSSLVGILGEGQSIANSSSAPAMTISKRHEDEAKLTVPYMISRLRESYNSTFKFLKVRLAEMKKKLSKYHHQNTMERMIGRIISESPSLSPDNSVCVLHVRLLFVSVDFLWVIEICILYVYIEP